MKNKRFLEIFLILALLGLIVLVINPMGFLMPHMLWLGCVIASAVSFLAFVLFVWQETASDEREVYNRMFAGRVGFLVGAGGLLIGIIVESLAGREVSVWLPVSLGAMVLAKLFAAIYSEEKF